MRASSLLCVVVTSCVLQGASHSHGPGGAAEMLRELMAGSGFRDFFAKHFLSPLPKMPIGSASEITVHPDGMKEQTFITSPMILSNGQIANKWMPVAWPEGHVALKSFVADVVTGQPDGTPPPATPCCDGPAVTPRNEVFMHHWTFNKWQLPEKVFEKLVTAGGMDYDVEKNLKQACEVILADAGLLTGANGPCIAGQLHLYFGIGDEVRGKGVNGSDSYSFPDPYGVEFDADYMRKNGQFMVLNTHLIDIRNVTDIRKCAECECAYHGVKPPTSRYTGGLACCHSTELDGGTCANKEGTKASVQSHFIRYTIKWRDVEAATPFVPLEVISFDATDNNSQWSDLSFLPGGYHEEHVATKNDPTSVATINDQRSGIEMHFDACHIEYFVPACRAGGSCKHMVKNSWEMPYPVDIVFVRNHFHAGGLDMVTRSNTSNICHGVPIYGANETAGRLLNIEPCSLTTPSDRSPSSPVRVEQGERIYIEALYQQDHLPHYGVMAMSFVYAHRLDLDKSRGISAPPVLV